MSTVRKVHVKWGKRKFSDIEVDITQPAIVFKMQLYSLSGVGPESQKILVKGKMLEDTTDMQALDLKDGATLMMMGTPDESIVKAPTSASVFIEDLPPDIAEAMQSSLPAGIDNIGNTCYLNATVQCLRAVTPLMDSVKSFNAGLTTRDPNDAFIGSYRDLINNLDRIGAATDPTFFNVIFRTLHPQFQEEERGGHRQQDADEAWNAILTSLALRLRSPSSPAASNLVDELFGIRFQSTMNCLEAPDEPATTTTDTTRKLSCHITGETNYLLEGIKLALSETITKRSPVLSRDASYSKKTIATHLPPWLTVHFVRFYYKAQQRERAKILRNVQFPRVLDLIDICGDETQRVLRKRRARAIELRDNKNKMTDDGAPSDAAAPAEEVPPSPGFTAQFELKAVLTHIGRTLDGGHYIGWVHRKGDEWLKFDDKTVSVCNFDEDIAKLSGGGDWHTAYLCLYQQRNED